MPLPVRTANAAFTSGWQVCFHKRKIQISLSICTPPVVPFANFSSSALCAPQVHEVVNKLLWSLLQNLILHSVSENDSEQYHQWSYDADRAVSLSGPAVSLHHSTGTQDCFEGVLGAMNPNFFTSGSQGPSDLSQSSFSFIFHSITSYDAIKSLLPQQFPISERYIFGGQNTINTCTVYPVISS